MIENVYFVNNYFGIWHFLSLYEPEASNLIVTSQHGSLRKLLDEIMPEAKRVVIPSMPRVMHPLRRLYQVFLRRTRQAGLLKDVTSSATAYYFTEFGAVQFYIAQGYLSRKHVDTRFVDAISANFYYERRPSNELKLTTRFYLWVLSQASGVRLTWMKTHNKDWLGLQEPVMPMPYSPDPWEAIVNKYGLSYRNHSSDSILLVDAPIQLLAGVDIAKSQTNLVRFASQLLDRGQRIHLKPHPGAPDKSSFDGTSIRDEITFVPAHYPVEMLMHQYQEVYYFMSASGSVPFSGKKYSLGRLLEFSSEEARDAFWTTYKDEFGEECELVEMVDLGKVRRHGDFIRHRLPIE
jgi:hypothetical protein